MGVGLGGIMGGAGGSGVMGGMGSHAVHMGGGSGVSMATDFLPLGSSTRCPLLFPSPLLHSSPPPPPPSTRGRMLDLNVEYRDK